MAGLIVIGNQGLGGRFSRMRCFLMGSVSEKVARYALLGDGDTQGSLRSALSLICIRSGAKFSNVQPKEVVRSLAASKY